MAPASLQAIWTTTGSRGSTAPAITTIPGPAGTANDINGNGTIVGSRSGQAIRIDGTTVTPITSLGGDFETATDVDGAGTDDRRIQPNGQCPTSLGPDRRSKRDAARHARGRQHRREQGQRGRAHRGYVPDTVRRHPVRHLGNGQIADHGNLGGDQATVVDMNEAGQFIGAIDIPTVGGRPVFWDGSTLTNLGTLGGSTSNASAINETSRIVGTSQDASGHWRAFISDSGGALADLGTLGGAEAFGIGINDHGQIAGTSFTAAGRQHGFLVDNGVMYDINSLLPAGSVEIRGAGAISDSGHIIADGVSGPILLVPGASATGRLRRRRHQRQLGCVHRCVPAGHERGPPGHRMGERPCVAVRRHDDFPLVPGLHRITDTRSTDRASSRAPPTTAATTTPSTTTARSTSSAHSADSQGDGQDINDAGDVVGGAMDAGEHYHAFLYRGGSMIDLHDLGGISSYAYRVNNAGTVIGGYSPSSSITRGFVSDGTTTTDLGTLRGRARPTPPRSTDPARSSARPRRRDPAVPRVPVRRRHDDEHRPSRLDLQ